MRIGEEEFDEKISTALTANVQASADFEARLSGLAEGLLSQRRERLFEKARRVALQEQSARARSLLMSRLLGLPLEIFQALALRPAAQLATLLVLVSAIFLLRPQDGGRSPRFSDLPEFPKFNDSPAKYDALWKSERQAYEREVEDVRRQTQVGS